MRVKLLNFFDNFFFKLSGFFNYLDPIDCSKENICRMSWLRRYRAGPDFNMDCSDGTSFKDLQSDIYGHCESTLSR